MEVITTIAVGVTGLATIALAYLTYLAFRENKKLIEASTTQAAAATVQAEAAKEMIGEIRRDRELAAEPFLKFDGGTGPTVGGTPTDFTVTITNIGKGQAINCLYCARYTWETAPQDVAGIGGVRPLQTNYYRSQAFHLEPRAPLHLPLSPTGNGQAMLIVGELPQQIGLVEAAVCQDQFGRRYRFRSDTPNPDIWYPGDECIGWPTWTPPTRQTLAQNDRTESML